MSKAICEGCVYSTLPKKESPCEHCYGGEEFESYAEWGGRNHVGYTGYESPIKIEYIEAGFRLMMENEVVKAVRNCQIHVDRKELVKALEYDRHQFSAGFVNGYKMGYERAREEIAKNERVVREGEGED